MVLEEKKIKNICNFYVSEYHLEIMLLPYISKKIENEEKIIIITEKDLRDSLKVVIDRTNIEEHRKKEIINLGWNNQKLENIIDNTNIILVGSSKFINNKTLKLKEKEIKNLTIIACYDYNEVKDNIQKIVTGYDEILNTLGINNI